MSKETLPVSEVAKVLVVRYLKHRAEGGLLDWACMTICINLAWELGVKDAFDLIVAERLDIADVDEG